MERYTGLVGTTEHFDQFVSAGVRLFPEYFGNGDYVSTNKKLQSIPERDVQALKEAARFYPPKLLKLETEFYEWMKHRAEQLYSKYAYKLQMGTWTPEPFFWEDGGKSPPWMDPKIGYRTASFDTPNDPRKEPNIF